MNNRLNQLAAEFTDINVRRTLMREFGKSTMPFSGKNEDGETVILHVAEDSIIVETFQSNGWVRKNYYGADGSAEGETFDGRWDR